jgi:hypothetical protein
LIRQEKEMEMDKKEGGKIMFTKLAVATIKSVKGVKEVDTFGKIVCVEFENGLFAAIMCNTRYSITFSEDTEIGTYGTDLAASELFDWVRCASELKSVNA